MELSGNKSTLRLHSSFPQSETRLEVDHPRIRKTRELAAIRRRGLKILDLGCASGYVTRPFVRDHYVLGLDGIKSSLDAAKQNGLETMLCDIDGPLPIEGGEFDLIFCTETLEHLVNTDLVLHEINRGLKPSGVLILSVPNIRTIVGIAMLLAGLPPMYCARYRSGHVRDFTAQTIRWAIENHGFRIERLIGGTIWLPWFGDVLSGLATRLPQWSATILLRAIKIEESIYEPEKDISPWNTIRRR